MPGGRGLGGGEARAGQEGDDREQQQAGAGAAEDPGRLDPVLLQHDPGAAERDQRQDEEQDGDREPRLAALLDLGEAALARLAGLVGGRRGGGVAGARLVLAALLVLAQPVGHADAFGVDREERLVRLARRNAVSSRLATAKAKGASPSWLRVIRVLTPSTRPHWSSKRPARMAAGDAGGVQEGGDAVDRADVGEDADRAGRRQRRDIILGRAGGGEIDIAGIAQERRPARRRRAGRCRAGSAVRAPLLELEQGEVAGRIDGDDTGAHRLRAFGRDDADRDVAALRPPGRRHGRW